ncbi:MAG TPA: ATP-binding protein [Gaiellaceae bacterium]|nr:ATP-binding protein [Gaiellaceae bacterium]
MATAPPIETTAPPRQLELAFHGRVIDHLGIQMYQSPIAAVAELVANAWDANAEHVQITFPDALDGEAEIVIADDGWGMTFDECQTRFLDVGRNRRGKEPVEKTPEKLRPVLGRKGIGKFAGFGIAHVIEIETISRENGEYTKFSLDLDELRKGRYTETKPAEVTVIAYAAPDDERRASHGTTVRLKRLSLKQRPSPAVQARGLARRFLLHQRVADFEITVDGNPLPASAGEEPVEFLFPGEYTDKEKPDGLTIADDGFGEETLSTGDSVRWQIGFYKEPIKDDELQGVAVFVGGKLAQTPFYFDLSGGTTAQAGLPYLSGLVEADFLDQQGDDLIATERQRVDWNNERSQALLVWGTKRIRELLTLWNDRRVEKKMKILDERIEPFADRLGRFQKKEQQTVRNALKKVAAIRSLTDDNFVSLAESMLVTWESGRLHDLIETVAEAQEMSDDDLVAILVEANVLTALAGAESARTSLLVVEGLKDRVDKKELENPLRDYVAAHPWLLGPEWETYKRETSVTNLLKEARKAAGLDNPEAWPKRIDLTLSAGRTLSIVEFMRPGVTVDFDHLSRWENYVLTVRAEVKANNALGFEFVHGLLVADNLGKKPAVIDKLDKLAADGMRAIDWPTLLGRAASEWREHFSLLVGRGEEDERLRKLADELGIPVPEQLPPPAPTE